MDSGIARSGDSSSFGARRTHEFGLSLVGERPIGQWFWDFQWLRKLVWELEVLAALLIGLGWGLARLG